jgi:putative hemolysin
VKLRFILLLLCLALLLIASGCTQTSNPGGTPPAAGTPAVTTTTSSLANPAAVFCQEKGYGYRIRRDSGGNEYGVCILPDGTECEEWAYYRGTCPAAPTSPAPVTPATTPGAGIANPSATFCESKNYTYRIITNPDGSQDGYCVFPSGKQCDGWSYYRGECNETTAK